MKHWKRALCVWCSLSLACSAHAAAISTVETDKAPPGVFGTPYAPIFPSGGPSSSDLLHGKLPSDSTGDFQREGAAGVTAITNGSVATFYGPPETGSNHSAYATAGNGAYLVYELGGPHNISSIVVYGGWNDNGRDAQHYNLLTSSDGTTFSLLSTIDIDFEDTEYSTPVSNRVAFTENALPNLALGVTHIRLNFLTVEAGYTGYSEIDVFGTVVPEPITLAGDYNANGVVDAADYVVWRDAFGQAGAGLAADGNGDGTIDAVDNDVWRAHFGQIAATGSGATADSSSSIDVEVPESTTFALAVLGIVTLLAGRSRHCRLLLEP